MVRTKETSKHRVAELVQFGEAVRKQRTLRSLSQEAFGDACGIDRSYMGGIERGEHNLALINILKIIRALDMQPSAFFQALDTTEEGTTAIKTSEPEPTGFRMALDKSTGGTKISPSKHKEALRGLANLLVEEVYQQLLERGTQALNKSQD